MLANNQTPFTVYYHKQITAEANAIVKVFGYLSTGQLRFWPDDDTKLNISTWPKYSQFMSACTKWSRCRQDVSLKTANVSLVVAKEEKSSEKPERIIPLQTIHISMQTVILLTTTSQICSKVK